MKISPPVAVLTIAAAGIAVTVWLAPAQREPPSPEKVRLSTTIQEESVLWTNYYLGADRKRLTTDQINDELFIKAPNEGDVPANRIGPLVK